MDYLGVRRSKQTNCVCVCVCVCVVREREVETEAVGGADIN